MFGECPIKRHLVKLTRPPCRRLAFETLLDGSRDASEQMVEMTTLRRLCATGQ